ncbi:MAG: NAD(P)H-dependent oxidoreductase [Pseudomonadota bacterium]
MNALIVYANPEPTSFSAALKNSARATLAAQGHRVVVSDLYAENFNPVAGRHDFTTVADAGRFHYQQEQMKASQEGGYCAQLVREQQRVADADLFIFVYPLWWGGMPAILKGWFDRVLSYGFAYADGKRFDSGFFQGRHGMVALTTGGTPERFSDGGVYGPIETLLYPHRRTMLEYLGLEVAPSFVAYASPRVSQAEREKYLADWSAQVAQLAQKISSGPATSKPLPKAAATGAGWASNADSSVDNRGQAVKS